MQRSLSHESNLRSRINQLSTPPSPSYHTQTNHNTSQQMPKYLTANSITPTSKSTNTSSSNLSKNNKFYRNSDERIHENIEYYINNENNNNNNSNNENYISANSVYNYSKNSIENMRRLSTEGSEYSSKCPSGTFLKN